MEFTKTNLASLVERRVLVHVHSLLDEDMSDNEIIHLGEAIYKIVVDSFEELRNSSEKEEPKYEGIKQVTLHLPSETDSKEN